MFKKIGLIGQLAVAIALGALVGAYAPGCVIRALNSFGGTFGQFIKFVVPFIIVGLVTPAIVETGRSAGKLLLLVMGIAYASTIFSGAFAYAVSSTVFPAVMDASAASAAGVKDLSAYFVIKIPPIMDVTTALVTAFMFGIGMAAVQADPLVRAFNALRDVVTLTIRRAVAPLLPLYIFAVIADLTASGRLMAVGGPCLKIMSLAMAVTSVVLLIQYMVAGLVARRNPLKALWTMMPAYLTGWGCCSSAATIPVSLRQVRANGVSGETADLVVPLCANVHLAGSMANMVVYTMGFLVMAGEPISWTAYVEFIFMVSIVAVASPGIPGGVVLASAAIAETTLGFTPERYALVIATYMALDGMGTACNLTGDGAIALIVDRFRRRKEEQPASNA